MKTTVLMIIRFTVLKSFHGMIIMAPGRYDHQFHNYCSTLTYVCTHISTQNTYELKWSIYAIQPNTILLIY